MDSRHPYHLHSLLYNFSANHHFFSSPYGIFKRLNYSYILPREYKLSFGYREFARSATALHNATIQNIEDTLTFWIEGTGLSLLRDDQSPDIYFLSNQPTAATGDFHAITIRGYPLSHNHWLRLGEPRFRPMYVFFNEKRFGQWAIESQQTKIKEVITHEVAHSFGFQHPFQFSTTSSGMLFPLSQQYTWYSALNYRPLLTKNFLPIHRVDPSAFDIDAAQFSFGTKTIRQGDDIYCLTSANFSTPHVRTIYDCGGIDTFSAAGYNGHALINLRNGIHDYSRVGTYYFTQTFQTTIENAIGGLGENTIFLNSKNNHIFLDPASGHTKIITFSYDVSTDTIEQFKPARGDIIEIGKPFADNLCTILRAIPMIKKPGTILTSNKGNIIHLPHVDLEEITENTIQFAKTDDPRQCSSLADPPINNRDSFFHMAREHRAWMGENSPITFLTETKTIPLPTYISIADDNSSIFSDCPIQVKNPIVNTSKASRMNSGWAPTLFHRMTGLVKSFMSRANEYLLHPGITFLAQHQQQIICAAVVALLEQQPGLFNISTKPHQLYLPRP